MKNAGTWYPFSYGLNNYHKISHCHKISPRTSLPPHTGGFAGEKKRGIVPPFGKGRVGGIFPIITIPITEGLPGPCC